MRKSKLVNRVVTMVRQSGGAHLTRRDREIALRQFLGLLDAEGIRLPRLENIRGTHLRRFVRLLLADDQAIRTVQKKAGHVRWLWRQLGRSDLAESRDLSNEALGIKTPEGGRRGTNRPATDTQIEHVVHNAERLKRRGIGMAARLMLAIGLRRNEVAYAGSGQLRRWLQQLEANQTLHIEDGTKGNRPRWVPIFNPEKTRALLKDALELTEAQGGTLILSKQGRPVSLKSANRILSGFFERAEITPHQLRYRFAWQRLDHYLAAGESLSEACRRLARDLGHGDSRARYVKMVYCREKLDRLLAKLAE